MLLLAAALTASINLSLDLPALVRRGQKAQPAATCGIGTVGYRFRGTPGQTFRYAGKTWQVPARGSIELLASKGKTTYAVEGRDLSLESWPSDPFGIREVPLPTASADQKGESQ